MWNSNVSDPARVFRLMQEANLTPAQLQSRFSSSGQPAVKLAAALLGFFFLPEAKEFHPGYAAYLQKRIRPAAETAIELGLPRVLAEMERLGWLNDLLTEQLYREAVRMRRAEAIAWLLQRKNRTVGFPDRDLSL